MTTQPAKLRTLSQALTVAVLLVFATSCSPPPSGPRSLRLVDLFSAATVEGSPEVLTATIPKTEWRFQGSDSLGWQAGAGVTGLGVKDGRLVGSSTSASPILQVERASGWEEEDLLHTVEVRLRASAGSRLSLRFSGSETVNLAQVNTDPFPWPASTPLVTGEERLYTLTPSRPVPASDIRHVLLRPTDEAGASFEIASVRLVFRREHLRSVPPGIGWHGLSDIYRESLVTRSPETVRFSLTLPSRPWLDLAVGTIEDGASTFVVEVEAEGSDSGPARVVERTVTRPNRWQPFPVALDDFAGRSVTLSLSVEAQEGSLGFWGTAAVRNLVSPGTPAAANGQGRSPRGVIVIVADTLRSDHVQAYGYGRETAPNLSRLAEAGVRAQDCFSQATWTKVSMPAIFTSLYPSSHTVHAFTDRLPQSAVTLAEVFRKEGYATLALVSITFAGQFTNLHQGYEELHESGSLTLSQAAKTSREYVDRLLPWLDSHRHVPFFVFLHVADPHSPYTPYAPYDTQWGKAGDQEEYLRQQRQIRPKIKHPVMRRFGMPARQEIEAAGLDPDEYVGYEKDGYDGSIRGMDVEIGRLLERLEELGLAEDTLIAFVSDHGTELLEHDAHFHGHSAYGELSRVPLLLRGPGVPRGVVIPQTVQTIDLMPTVLELSGIEAPEGVQGQSLVPLFHTSDGSAPRWRQRPAVTEKAQIDGDLPGRSYESIALVSDGWRLIHNTPAPAGVAQYELYDHTTDPINLKDVAAQHPEEVERLAKQLEEWRKYVLAGRLKSDEEAAKDLSAEELERLRSLGYL